MAVTSAAGRAQIRGRIREVGLAHALALGVLLRSIVVEREPIYREAETVHAYAASLFGLEESQLRQLSDDRLGRALERLYDADRAALLTAVVLAVGRSFGVRFDELHNDSTSIRFCGQYRKQPELIRGRRPARLAFGFSKNVAAKNMWRQFPRELPPSCGSDDLAHIYFPL